MGEAAEIPRHDEGMQAPLVYHLQIGDGALGIGFQQLKFEAGGLCRQRCRWLQA
jgi:hypothetical protein